MSFHCVVRPHNCRLEEPRVRSEASVCSRVALARAAAFRNRFYSIL